MADEGKKTRFIPSSLARSLAGRVTPTRKRKKKESLKNQRKKKVCPRQ